MAYPYLRINDLAQDCSAMVSSSQRVCSAYSKNRPFRTFMMPSLSTFLLVALSAIVVKATNTAGDPTDLASPVASSLASYPATITANSIASAILATTTPLAGSDLGNGANIVDYPECAQFCGNQSVAVANCNVETLDCACGANYLSIAAACEQVVCSDSDRAGTSNLL